MNNWAIVFIIVGIVVVVSIIAGGVITSKAIGKVTNQSNGGSQDSDSEGMRLNY